MAPLQGFSYFSSVDANSGCVAESLAFFRLWFLLVTERILFLERYFLVCLFVLFMLVFFTGELMESSSMYPLLVGFHDICFVLFLSFYFWPLKFFSSLSSWLKCSLSHLGYHCIVSLYRCWFSNSFFFVWRSSTRYSGPISSSTVFSIHVWINKYALSIMFLISTHPSFLVYSILSFFLKLISGSES